MRDGVDRSNVPYVWPGTIEQPVRPPKLVYLDLNHWIALSKAFSGHADGVRHREVLDACVSAIEDNRAVFPIADAIYAEISKITRHRQRRDLHCVIERLSCYRVVMTRTLVARHEIEALLDDLVGPRPERIMSMPYLDWGVARAFGIVGGFRMRSASGDDVTEKIREQWGEGPDAFDHLLASAELELQRRVIEGPTLEEEPELRNLGWNPTAAVEVAKRRAQQEIEQVGRLDTDPRWRRGRLRDLVAAREILIEINEMLFDALTARSVTLEAVFPEPSATRQALDSMISFDVAVTLKTAYHRDPRHQWTPNDIHDIDALGSTVPYCDVVLTDKAAGHHLNTSGLAQRCGTVVLSRLSDLAAYL